MSRKTGRGNDANPTGRRAVEEIDVRLGGVFDKLAGAIEEAAGRLAEGTEMGKRSGSPIRTEGHLRVRVGGLDLSPQRTDGAERPPASARQVEPEVWEEDGDLVATVELPGAAEEDLAMDFRGGVLTGETRAPHQYRFEVQVPAPAAEDAIEATLVNGILELRIRGGAGG